MKSTCFLLAVILFVSCSEEPKPRPAGEPNTLRSYLRTTLPEKRFHVNDFQVKIVKTAFLEGEDGGADYRVDAVLVNNSGRPFDRLFYSCEFDLVTENAACRQLIVYCNASYPMCERILAGGKISGTCMLFRGDRPVKTRLRWHIRNSGLLQTDEHGRVKTPEEIQIFQELDIYSEEITIPAKEERPSAEAKGLQ